MFSRVLCPFVRRCGITMYQRPICASTRVTHVCHRPPRAKMRSAKRSSLLAYASEARFTGDSVAVLVLMCSLIHAIFTPSFAHLVFHTQRSLLTSRDCGSVQLELVRTLAATDRLCYGRQQLGSPNVLFKNTPGTPTAIIFLLLPMVPSDCGAMAWILRP